MVDPWSFLLCVLHCNAACFSWTISLLFIIQRTNQSSKYVNNLIHCHLIFVIVTIFSCKCFIIFSICTQSIYIVLPWQERIDSDFNVKKPKSFQVLSFLLVLQWLGYWCTALETDMKYIFLLLFQKVLNGGDYIFSSCRKGFVTNCYMEFKDSVVEHAFHSLNGAHQNSSSQLLNAITYRLLWLSIIIEPYVDRFRRIFLFVRTMVVGRNDY